MKNHIKTDECVGFLFSGVTRGQSWGGVGNISGGQVFAETETSGYNCGLHGTKRSEQQAVRA